MLHNSERWRDIVSGCVYSKQDVHTGRTNRKKRKSVFGPRQTQSVSENAIPSLCNVQFILSIYRFKRDNFLSENIIFESKTCIQNGQYFERSLELTSCECDVRRVERLGSPSLTP